MRYLFPMLLLAACNTSPAPDVPAGSPTGAAQELPTLRLEGEFNVPELRDLNRGSQVAVTSQGALVFASDDELVLRVRHLDGRTLAFGRRGQGPDEVSSPMFLFATDSTIAYRDPSQERTVVFGLDGTPLSSERVRLPFVNTSAVIDGDQALFAWGPANTERHVTRVNARTGRVTAVDVSADSFAARWAFTGHGHDAGDPPIPGVWYGGFLLADRASYEIGFYSWTGELEGVYQQPAGAPNFPSEAEVDALVAGLSQAGRKVSPAQREKMLQKHQPWFHVSARMDALRRTWILVNRDGRPELDVFLGPERLGTLPLDCKGPGQRWDLSGRWLAVNCLPSSPGSDEDAVIQLYEIQ